MTQVVHIVRVLSQVVGLARLATSFSNLSFQ